MVEFRIRRAGYRGANYLFLEEAIQEIYYYTKGYPRGIIRTCHKCLRELVMSKTKSVVDRQVATSVIEKDSISELQKIRAA